MRGKQKYTAILIKASHHRSKKKIIHSVLVR